MKKNSPPKKGAIRDLAIKKTDQGDAFLVKSLHAEDDIPLVEPLQEDDSFQDTQDDLESRLPVHAYEQPFHHEPVVRDHQPVQSIPAVSAPPDVPKIVSEPFKDPKDYVKLSFAKFVQLVANHDFDQVVKNNEQEEVILSSNLLADLASAHDKEEGRKIPLVFLVGLAIGVVLTYILITS